MIDYLFIGDSYTQGACVNRGENIPDSLRKISNKSVLNLGMRGNGTLIEYATLKEYTKDKNIKNLILIFTVNDIEDLEIEKKNLILKKYLDNENYTQNLKSKQKKIDDFIINFIEKKSKIIESTKFSFFKLSKTRSFIKKVITSNQRAQLDKSEDYQTFYEIIKKI
ncbi:hypothetical protein OAB53_04415, partial [Candidatus Pelagibacter sp.]|nr:hypothetical protein [Candidatus Pelagibacter sp.]